MRKLILIALSLVFTTVGAAQEHTERATPSPTPSRIQSQKYVSEAGRYSVMFPSEPKLSTQEITGPTGDRFTQYMTMATGDGLLYMVGYFDYGSNIAFNLDKARDGMVESIKGTLLDEHSISLGGAPGRQLKVVGSTDQGLAFINRARFYDTSPRVYVLQCMVPKSDDSAAAADKCEQFFDSFKMRMMS